MGRLLNTSCREGRRGETRTCRYCCGLDGRNTRPRRSLCTSRVCCLHCTLGACTICTLYAAPDARRTPSPKAVRTHALHSLAGTQSCMPPSALRIRSFSQLTAVIHISAFLHRSTLRPPLTFPRSTQVQPLPSLLHLSRAEESLLCVIQRQSPTGSKHAYLIQPRRSSFPFSRTFRDAQLTLIFPSSCPPRRRTSPVAHLHPSPSGNASLSRRLSLATPSVELPDCLCHRRLDIGTEPPPSRHPSNPSSQNSWSHQTRSPSLFV